MGHVSDPSRIRLTARPAPLLVPTRYDARVPRRLFVFDDPDRFVAGTIGEPGSRTFYLQVREGSAVVSVSLEKVQVAALAARLSELLAVLEVTVPDPDTTSADAAPLDQPLGELFRVGAIALAWDPDTERLVIEAQPLSDEADYVEVPDDDPDGPDLMRVRIGPAVAQTFAARATQLVASGRPACPFCGMPLESTGHFCPRANGQLN
jgi:uncharacterized repeat protein (TIGR03847 family)